MTDGYLKAPRFVVDGQKVLYRRRCRKHQGQLVVCTVATAMGYTARVMNAELGIDTWASTDDLLVEAPEVDA